MQDLIDYLNHAIQLYALDIVLAIVILVVGMWVVKGIRSIAGKVFRKRSVDETLARFLANIIYAFLVTVVFIAAIGQLGVDTTSLVAIVGAAGLAIGFALQGSLSNFASGVMIIIFKPFVAGHYVEVAGVAGSVEEVSVFNTILKTPDNKRVILPNSQITGGSITNYSVEETRRIDLVFGIGYGDDIRKAKEVMTRVVTSDERVLKDPAPTIAVLELADSSVNFVVRPWVKTADFWDVYFDITERMKQQFDAEGISIPFPQHDVHLFQKKN
ncbi:MAG: mechanosensitive ion channel [Bacteroidetes bacterium]|nr:mechanosensitive ion channel [Bacteroidota bacterium]